MLLQPHTVSAQGKVMLVGLDRDQILERRFHAANWQVVTLLESQSALDLARRERFDLAVMIVKGSLINIAEMIFNLRDINRSMEIVILVDRLGGHASRLLRQLIEHPLERTRILTRRQLQRQIHRFFPQAPPGAMV